MTNLYLDALNKAHAEVENYLTSGKKPSWKNKLSSIRCAVPNDATFTPATIDLALETIVKNIPSSKYIFSIVLCEENSRSGSRHQTCTNEHG